jgi:hypothetical protein
MNLHLLIYEYLLHFVYGFRTNALETCIEPRWIVFDTTIDDKVYGA